MSLYEVTGHAGSDKVSVSVLIRWGVVAFLRVARFRGDFKISREDVVKGKNWGVSFISQGYFRDVLEMDKGQCGIFQG